MRRTATQDSYVIAEDSTLAVAAPGVLGNDSDPNGDVLVAAIVSGPAHGTLLFDLNGGFAYAPNFDYFGTDSFTYRASDGVLLARSPRSRSRWRPSTSRR